MKIRPRAEFEETVTYNYANPCSNPARKRNQTQRLSRSLPGRRPPRHAVCSLAIVGPGIYPRDAHLPALAHLQERFELAAIFSRSESSARALAEHWHSLTAAAGHETMENFPSRQSTPELFTDLAALFTAHDDIEAVDIALPIPVQPPVVAQALAAGKHVVAEAHRPHTHRGTVID